MSVDLGACTVVLAHGAGSDAAFLRAAFPSDRLGTAQCRYLDDRTASVNEIATQLQSVAAATSGPVVIGGVSLGAHAAAQVLANSVPANVVAGILCMPAWTGPPDRVASMTAAAATALETLGIEGVLVELDADDWVTPQLARAWRRQPVEDLVAQMRTAAQQVAPSSRELTRISVPTVVIGLDDDPLHPVTVAAEWRDAIPHAALVTLDRFAPAPDLSVFAGAVGDALLDQAAYPSR